MKATFVSSLFLLFMVTSCLSPNHVTVQHYDLGLRDAGKSLNWKLASISYAGYRSDKILTREGQSLQEDHSLRWKEDPDDLLKNFWLANFDQVANATDIKVKVLRFEFYKDKAQVLVLVNWAEGKKSKRVFTEAPVNGVTVEAKVAAMSQAVDSLTEKISQAVQ